MAAPKTNLVRQGYTRAEALHLMGEALAQPFLVGRRPADLDPGDSLYEFVKRFDLKIDNHRYDLDGEYAHLRELYEEKRRDIAVMAGAQTGKTAWELALMFYIGLIEWGHNVGAYYPDMHLPRNFSRGRFAPMVRANPRIGKWLGVTGRIDPRTGKKERGADQVYTRSLGPTTYFFLSVRGVSSTEGLPMKAVLFDEVRRMAEGDMQRAEERASAQENPWFIRVSTAQFPESDIHKHFLRGDQQYFHSECKCPNGIVLSQSWPECVLDLGTATEALRTEARVAFASRGLPYLGLSEEEGKRYGEAVYRCPTCGTILANPREGWWEPAAPENYPASYQLPQILSRVWPAARVWAFWRRPGLDVQEFHNSKLGLPYIDADNTPVTIAQLWACVRSELPWAGHMSRQWRRENLRKVSMGVDVQKGYLVVVIKERAENGKARTVHLEILGGNDPWRSLGKLMLEFDVKIAVVDSAPEFDSARRFALDFRGRVYLAQYVDSQTGDMVTWADRHKAGQKGETAFKYVVNINRTRAFQWSLALWAEGECEIPDPRMLVQPLPRSNGKVVLTANLAGGDMEATRIAEEVYFVHLTRVVFTREYPKDDPDGLTGRFRIVAQHVGLDPHMAHADLYADVALSRAGAARPQSSG